MPQPIAERDIVPLMNAGRYTFVIDIPPNFERDVLAGASPALQIDVDATAMVQAGLGSGYAQQIVTNEIADFLSHAEGAPLSPVNLDVRIAFNPNVTTAWFTSVMGIINNVTMLAIILAGAAIVREREHGTMDHLLVMPLTPFEIAMSKVWANGLVITVAVGLSLYVVVRAILGIPIAGSIPLFMIGVVAYLFFAYRDRHFSRHGGALHAAARAALPAGLHADEHAFGQQHAAGKHAALARDGDAGVALDAFRAVCAVDPLSRRGHRRGLAAISSGRGDRRLVLRPRHRTLPQCHRAGDVKGSECRFQFISLRSLGRAHPWRDNREMVAGRPGRDASRSRHV